MNKLQAFDQFFMTNTPHVSIIQFIVNLLLVIVFAYLLEKLYVRCGRSLSNRKKFSENFFIMIATTMLIITVVKSSLALSLGLVGALSIVRFRAAIKEPEELMYLFLAIAVGLGLGANQRFLTIIGFSGIASVIWFKMRFYKQAEGTPFLLTFENLKQNQLAEISQILSQHTTHFEVKRVFEKEQTELSFIVQLSSPSVLSNIRDAVKALDDTMSMTYINHHI